MDNTKRGANPNQGKYLVCIGGWGSTAQIFDPLISECPELRKFEEAQKIELHWQDFACLDLPARRSALRRAFAGQFCPGAEISAQQPLQRNGIILAWSLGAMLALELALELAQEFQPQKNEGMENAPKHSGNTKSRLRLILLSGTAAMCRPSVGCRSCEECGPSVGCDPKKPESKATEKIDNGNNYPFVPDAALRAMQRKLSANPNAVLRNFAQNCCKDTGAESSQVPQSGEEDPFIALYLRQAAHFLPPKNEILKNAHAAQAPTKKENTGSKTNKGPLASGLEYLLHCDLCAELQSCPLPFPVLLATGREDAIIPCGQTEALAQLLPKSSLALLDAGHNLLSPPAAGLTERIAAFLRR